MATFYANQDYIAETLCVNRDKPEMHCNGHCQLNKKLQEENHKDQSVPGQRSANDLAVFFLHPVMDITLTPAYDTHTPLNGIYLPLTGQDCLMQLLHPPTV